MTGYFCPIEGCEKHHDQWTKEDSPHPSLDSLQGHLVAMSDGDHRSAREEQGLQALLKAAKAGAGSEDADPEGDDQEDEADDHPPEGADEAGEEAPEDMDSDEYQDQHDRSTGSTSSDQDGSGNGSGDADPGEGAGGWSLPKLSTTTIVVLIGVVGLLLIYAHVTSGGSTSADQAPEALDEGSQASDDSDDQTPEASSGTFGEVIEQ
jgi:hypothetical protein